MLDIEKLVGDSFEFTVKNIMPYKDYFIIQTGRERKVLKRSILRPERLLYVHDVKEYLHRQGFGNIDRYICTKEGFPFFLYNNTCYTVNDWIEGRESDFDNLKDIKRASRLLAQLHNASRGYVPVQGCLPRNDLGKTPAHFEKRLLELKKLKKIALKGKSRFDYQFQETVDYFIETGQQALGLLQGKEYARTVEKSRSEGVICHHDYNHHNIIFGESNPWVLNFEYCSSELKVYDIANFLRRRMRKCNWNLQDAGIILDEYRKTSEISKDEFIVLKAMLEFPQKFWRVANKFYNSKRSWAEKSYLSKLQDVVAEIEPHRRFMERLDELF